MLDTYGAKVVRPKEIYAIKMCIRDSMNIADYIAPELLLIVPVLWVFGRLLKEAAFVKDKYIPLILGGVGVLLAVCYIVGSGTAVTATGIFTAITQGILCAGAAVYLSLIHI